MTELIRPNSDHLLGISVDTALYLNIYVAPRTVQRCSQSTISPQKK